MSLDLFASYEHEFNDVKASVVGRLHNEIPNLSGARRYEAIRACAREIDEASQLVDQIEMELRELSPQDRAQRSQTLDMLRGELEDLEKELEEAKRNPATERDERGALFGDMDSTNPDEQRARLLDNTERVQQMGTRLDDAYRVAIETEQVGQDTLNDLYSQRETLHRARNTLKSTESDMKKAQRILNAMFRRIMQNKIIMYGLIAFVVIVFLVIVFTKIF
eukprot:Clim_evm63s236 gene=Clim_evmTU63s236